MQNSPWLPSTLRGKPKVWLPSCFPELISNLLFAFLAILWICQAHSRFRVFCLFVCFTFLFSLPGRLFSQYVWLTHFRSLFKCHFSRGAFLESPIKKSTLCSPFLHSALLSFTVLLSVCPALPPILPTPTLINKFHECRNLDLSYLLLQLQHLEQDLICSRNSIVVDGMSEWVEW